MLARVQACLHAYLPACVRARACGRVSAWVSIGQHGSSASRNTSCARSTRPAQDEARTNAT
eukprot:9868674-Alexandrium_andersonii.AAC.1